MADATQDSTDFQGARTAAPAKGLPSRWMSKLTWVQSRWGSKQGEPMVEDISVRTGIRRPATADPHERALTPGQLVDPAPQPCLDSTRSVFRSERCLC